MYEESETWERAGPVILPYYIQFYDFNYSSSKKPVPFLALLTAGWELPGGFQLLKKLHGAYDLVPMIWCP